MGFQPQFFTVLFAVPRITGYLAHWRETLTDPDTRIVRPQQDYRGVWLRGYAPLEARGRPGAEEGEEEEGGRVGGGGAGDEMGPVPPSSAYVRRVSGTGWR